MFNFILNSLNLKILIIFLKFIIHVVIKTNFVANFNLHYYFSLILYYYFKQKLFIFINLINILMFMFIKFIGSKFIIFIIRMLHFQNK